MDDLAQTNSKAIDGSALSAQLLDSLKRQIRDQALKPVLNIVVDPDNAVSQGYVDLKQQRAAEIGLQVIIHQICDQDSTDEVISLVNKLTTDTTDGLIVQLPLPSRFDTKQILDSIPPVNDVDVLNRTAKSELYLQPVAGAVKTALKSVGFDVEKLAALPEGSVHVVGKGFLVGLPVSNWLQAVGVTPIQYQKGDDLTGLQNAKIIISGVGQANLITPGLISNGVILIDAGTTSDSGELSGDIDPTCYAKASFYTPVPGGIGPLTLAMLFQNVIIVSKLAK